MIKPRETIALGILARLQTLTSFTTVGREWLGIDNGLQEGNLPALYLLENAEKHKHQGRRMPAVIDLSFDVVIVLAKPDGAEGAAILNPVLDQVDALFLPQPAEMGAAMMLNGLVFDIFVEGQVIKNFSYLTNRACYAVIPLHVRVANPS